MPRSPQKGSTVKLRIATVGVLTALAIPSTVSAAPPVVKTPEGLVFSLKVSDSYALAFMTGTRRSAPGAKCGFIYSHRVFLCKVGVQRFNLLTVPTAGRVVSWSMVYGSVRLVSCRPACASFRF
jgi:hypothetical protein